MEKLLKENFLVLLIPIVVIGLGAYFDITGVQNAISSQQEVTSIEAEVQSLQDKLNKIRKDKAMSENGPKKRESESGKVIYEVLGQQFSPEASFGIMFENMLSNITNSGVRIRSIEYDYQPFNDKILSTNVSGYNACELSFVTVGTYSQLQNFFKSIVKENYLSCIQEILLEPYEKDKTILIAKFKVRLYTKTI